MKVILLYRFYDPKSSNIQSHLNCSSKSIDAHLSKWESIILFENFNSTMMDPSVKAFCETYEFSSLVKEGNFKKHRELNMHQINFV